MVMDLVPMLADLHTYSTLTDECVGEFTIQFTYIKWCNTQNWSKNCSVDSLTDSGQVKPVWANQKIFWYIPIQQLPLPIHFSQTHVVKYDVGSLTKWNGPYRRKMERHGTWHQDPSCDHSVWPWYHHSEKAFPIKECNLHDQVRGISHQKGITHLNIITRKREAFDHGTIKPDFLYVYWNLKCLWSKNLR